MSPEEVKQRRARKPKPTELDKLIAQLESCPQTLTVGELVDQLKSLRGVLGVLSQL